MTFSAIVIQAGGVAGIGVGALVFMLVSMGSVVALTGWCFYRILTTRDHFDPDGTGPARTPVSGEAERRKGS
jgi:hypothetical protein